jgi:hypothetical protein
MSPSSFENNKNKFYSPTKSNKNSNQSGKAQTGFDENNRKIPYKRLQHLRK